MPRSSERRRGKRTLSGVARVCVFAAAGCAVPCFTHAASNPGSSAYELNIPSQSLEEALQEFARQSGIQVVFYSGITDEVRAPELAGEYTLSAAMVRLLSESRLSFRQLNSRTIEVRQSPQRLSVSGSARRSSAEERMPNPGPGGAAMAADPVDEVYVLGKAEQLVASRIPTSLREIPQSVSVVSRIQMRQQNSFDLSDLLARAPGIATLRSNSLDLDLYSRAFKITSFHVDGGGALKPSFGSGALFKGTPDLSEFDHVEILRGSDALFAGNSNPGGTVSLVRKRPLAAPQLEMNAMFGSWKSRRIEIDASGPIASDGLLRGRVGAVYTAHDYFFDSANRERKQFFAALEYDLAPGSTLTGGGSYQWDDALPVLNGLPLYSSGDDSGLPRNTSLAFDWAFYRTRLGSAYLQYRRELGDDWRLRLNATSGRWQVEYGYGLFPSLINVQTGTLGSPFATFTSRPNVTRQHTMDLTLTGELAWFGLREEIAIGADVMQVQGDEPAEIYSVVGPPLHGVLAFDPRNYPDPRLAAPPPFSFDIATRLTQYGAFASLRVHLNDDWLATAGARVTSDFARTRDRSGTAQLPAIFSNGYGSNNVVTPFLGLVYLFDEHYSAYASYADIYLTNAYTARADSRPIGPAHGATLELGLKGAWRDGALNGSLALYRLAQRNVAIADPRPRPPDRDPASCCFLGATAYSRGAEAEINGEIVAGWLIGAGYTYNLNEAAVGGTLSRPTPRHFLKMWTSLPLSGALARWTVGGSLRAQSRAPGTIVASCVRGAGCTDVEVPQKRFAVLDLRAGFQIDPNWQVALTVNNVVDKRYYDSLASSLWYGEPRNYALQIDARY